MYRLVWARFNLVNMRYYIDTFDNPQVALSGVFEEFEDVTNRLFAKVNYCQGLNNLGF